jgi:hypothetical protein
MISQLVLLLDSSHLVAQEPAVQMIKQEVSLIFIAG